MRWRVGPSQPIWTTYQLPVWTHYPARLTCLFCGFANPKNNNGRIYIVADKAVYCNTILTCETPDLCVDHILFWSKTLEKAHLQNNKLLWREACKNQMCYSTWDICLKKVNTKLDSILIWLGQNIVNSEHPNHINIEKIHKERERERA